MADTRSLDGTEIVYVPASEMNSQKPATWIEKTPEVCGGDARIRRTRIPVSLLVEMRLRGAPDEEFFISYPSLTPADLKAGWEYYERNKREIDEAIAQDEEAMRLDTEELEQK